MQLYFPAGLVGGMVLPGLVAPELPGMPVPAPLEVPLLPLLMPLLPLLPVPLLPLPLPMLLPLAPPELSGMLPDEPDMPEEPVAPVPELPEAPELSGMLLPLPLAPLLLPVLPAVPGAPELPADRPDMELHAASAHMHAANAICFIMRFLLGLKDTAHVRPPNR